MKTSKPQKRPIVLRALVYLAGVLFLAFGISLTTQVNLGVSPIISIAYAFTAIWQQSFPNMAFVVYAIFVAIQVLLHLAAKRYHAIPLDLAQLVVNVVLTRFFALTGGWIASLASGMMHPLFTQMAGRVVLLLVAILFTGVGAAMCLNMRLVPNPGDGIVQTLSDLSEKPLGLVKNLFDISCVLFTLIFSLVFAGKIIGIGLGTVLAMLGVGRVIALYQHFTRRIWLLQPEPVAPEPAVSTPFHKEAK